MTTAAVESLKAIHADLGRIIHSLSDDEWQLPSACEGWSVHDLIAHVTSNFKEMVDPTPPAEDAPSEIIAEEAMEALVEARRGWSSEQLLAEYDQHAPAAFAAMAAMQEEPTASTVVPMADLGSYPLHMIANAYAFDHYCHMYIDLLAPGGPVARRIEPATDKVLAPGIEWMLAGTPQMCRAALAGMTQPVTLELTGPGGGTWTVQPPGEDDLTTVVDGTGGDATVKSSAHDYVSWGTKRTGWRDSCTVTGDEAAAAAMLDALNII